MSATSKLDSKRKAEAFLAKLKSFDDATSDEDDEEFDKINRAIKRKIEHTATTSKTKHGSAQSSLLSGSHIPSLKRAATVDEPESSIVEKSRKAKIKRTKSDPPLKSSTESVKSDDTSQSTKGLFSGFTFCKNSSQSVLHSNDLSRLHTQ